MRRVSMATRDELIRALSRRYSEVKRIERSRILDEFVAVTGYHRKHAMRVLRDGCTGSRHGLRPGRRVYGDEVREAILLLWEASDRVCGKRLKALLPVLVGAMERHSRLKLDPAVRAGVLAMSAATMDRALPPVHCVAPAQRLCRACGGQFRFVHSSIGMIQRQALSRRTWWCTVARRRVAAMCRRWY